jgi:hypothetical protein
VFPVGQVLPFFEGMGFQLPERKGVADFLQEVTSPKDQAVSIFTACHDGQMCSDCTCRSMHLVLRTAVLLHSQGSRATVIHLPPELKVFMSISSAAILGAPDPAIPVRAGLRVCACIPDDRHGPPDARIAGHAL